MSGYSDPARTIRKAVAHYRSTGHPADAKVAVLLDMCAAEADDMADPSDFSATDLPVEDALAVGLALTEGS